MRTGIGKAIAAAACTHPDELRSGMQTFGQKKDDVTQFWCRGCERFVTFKELEARNDGNEVSRS